MDKSVSEHLDAGVPRQQRRGLGYASYLIGCLFAYDPECLRKRIVGQAVLRATRRPEGRRGRVFIYDGLRDFEIERVLDEQFDRIESMMFVNTVVTDDGAVPLTDPEAGALLVEDDGCD